jgi:methylated-DNA-[protein]-cysteine S-methyltransferase
VELFRANVDSPVGPWGVEGDHDVIVRVYLPNEHKPASSGAVPEAVALGVGQLEEYFAGRRRTFDVPLAQTTATPFRRDVWGALCEIPYGQVQTYADIAIAVSRPGAARAVGNANHANPFAIIVPCHRVVASHALGGYGGGAEVKRYLLGLEGVSYD